MGLPVGFFDIFDVFNSFNAAYVRQIQLLISVHLKFHDLRLRRFGLVFALSPSECRQAILIASRAHSKGTRRSTMEGQLLKTIDELGVTVASS